MRILINHMTRMHGARICLAGLDLETERHVRPLTGSAAVPFYLLARYGGPFDMARIVDLGTPRHAPDPPHVEDHVFVPAQVRFVRPAAAHEFWLYLERGCRKRLREIFGSVLREVGRRRWAADVGQGHTSLGLLRPTAPPKLYVAQRDGKPHIRMTIDDGDIRVDAGVTDLRLFGDDHAAVDSARVRAAVQWMADASDIILGVGLTRKFRAAAGGAEFHWLQVNNIHLKENPVWVLG